jgi:alkylhydroperoxidase family enzyme
MEYLKFLMVKMPNVVLQLEVEVPVAVAVVMVVVAVAAVVVVVAAVAVVVVWIYGCIRCWAIHTYLLIKEHFTVR